MPQLGNGSWRRGDFRWLWGAKTVSDFGSLVSRAALSFTAILYENETPATSAFITKLVQAKYYDGRQFGRVIPGFVIQEVDRTGGTTDQKEHVKLESGTDVLFSAGALGHNLSVGLGMALAARRLGRRSSTQPLAVRCPAHASCFRKES